MPCPTSSRRLLAVLVHTENALACSAFAVMVAAIFADVAAREVGAAGLLWAREIAVLANVVLVLTGMGLASAAGVHLRPRFADRWLPSRWDTLVVRAQEGTMAAFCLLLAALGAHLAVESLALGERTAVLGLPAWPFMAVLPLAFLVTALHHVLFALHPELRPPERLGAAGATPG